MRKTRKTFIASVAAAAVSVVALAPAAASADESAPTLVEILTSDSDKDNKHGFDRRWWDFDIVTEALIATNGLNGLVDVASMDDPDITAFIPTDLAFKRAIRELGGPWIWNERKAFNWLVENLGVEQISAVLQYHIVVAGDPNPPVAISFAIAKQADGAVLTTVFGPDLEVDVRGRWWKRVQLIDNLDRRVTVVRPNVGGEASNGYAHGINKVLLPIVPAVG